MLITGASGCCILVIGLISGVGVMTGVGVIAGIGVP
jgi:hypothetical protein